jgi:phosphomannomutase
VALTEHTRQILERRLAQESWDTLEGRRVVEVSRTDGLRLTFEGGGWILIRVSGTEPKVRLYAEGHSSEEMRHLMHLARQLIANGRL